MSHREVFSLWMVLWDWCWNRHSSSSSGKSSTVGLLVVVTGTVDVAVVEYSFFNSDEQSHQRSTRPLWCADRGYGGNIYKIMQKPNIPWYIYKKRQTELTYSTISGGKIVTRCLRRYPFSQSSVSLSVFSSVFHMSLCLLSIISQEVKRATASFVPLSQQPLAPNWCHTRVGPKITDRPGQLPLHAVGDKTHNICGWIFIFFFITAISFLLKF